MFYAVARLNISKPDALAAYRDKAGAALAKHGGKVEVASADLGVLDGAPDTSGMVALLSFPDKAAAEGWINDPELADTHALRRDAGTSDIFTIG